MQEAAESARELDELVARRVAGEPLEYIVGWAAFAGLRVRIRPGVFVPRRRTELLVDLAAPLLRAGSVVVDLCCGSGAVGLALASRVPGIDLAAADIEPAAVRCARDNVAPVHGRVFEGDLYAALPAELRGMVDVIAVNAPYVPTEEIRFMPPEARDHEPLVTLDGGADGLDLHRRIAAGAPEWLRPGGMLLIESSERQAPASAALFTAVGFDAEIRHDEERDATVVIATRALPRRVHAG